MTISKDYSIFQALNKNIVYKEFFNLAELPHASITLEYLYTNVPESTEQTTLDNFHNPEKQNVTKANIFNECTVLPDGFFQKHFPEDAPIPKRINIKAVKVQCVKNRNTQQERIELVFFERLNIKRIERFIHESRPGKRRFFKGRSFKKVLHDPLLWIMKSFDLAFKGKVNPSFQTIADISKVHRNTCIKYLQNHREMGVIDWDSGKKTYETNTYHLCEAYRELIIPRPKNVTLPGWLHYAIMRLIFIEKGWYKQKLINHISRENVHHKLLVYLSFRTALDEMRKNAQKSGSDPPKGKRKSNCWHILKPFSFSAKDRAILAHYGEAILRSAIDDFNAFKSWKKEVNNEVGFLISRCKHHKDRLKQREEFDKPCKPQEALEWLKENLTTLKDKLVFLKSESQVNRSVAAENTRPGILLKIHSEVERSIFRIYQKVRGVWIDKEFIFDRPDFKLAVTNYFEQSFKEAIG